MRPNTPWRPIGLVLGTALMAAAAHAQSDAQVYENAVARSANVCTGHSTDRTTPGVRAVKVDALRVLARNDVTLCPDRRLHADTPVVWYGAARVLAWNPEAKPAISLVAAKADAMSRKEDFPPETLVWKADGSAVQGAVVPAFELRRIPANAPRIGIDAR